MINNSLVPMVIQKTKEGERVMDLGSRLLEDRIISLDTEVNSVSSSIIASSMLYLDSISNEPIHFYINSPGGSVIAGFQIYDTMRMIKSPVHTYVVGQAASMGSLLASSGEKGFRFISENSTHMMHQVSAGTSGNVQEMRVSMEETERINDQLMGIYAKNTGKTVKKLKTHMVWDKYMVPKQCVEFGLCDKIV